MKTIYRTDLNKLIKLFHNFRTNKSIIELHYLKVNNIFLILVRELKDSNCILYSESLRW